MKELSLPYVLFICLLSLLVIPFIWCRGLLTKKKAKHVTLEQKIWANSIHR